MAGNNFRKLHELTPNLKIKTLLIEFKNFHFANGLSFHDLNGILDVIKTYYGSENG